MSHTVKAAVPRKRDKRVVENDEFGSFARRIMRAYARRVAEGDIEALVSLRTLGSALDTATADAVQGLRAFGYSWADIALRLGVTRQAAQMRWGNRDDRGRLDARILTPGMGITVAQLVAVFAEHHPGNPPAATCPGCAYAYPEGVTDCPTNKIVRPLLYQRRHEDTTAVARLSPAQFEDLHDRRVQRANRAAERAHASASPVLGQRRVAVRPDRRRPVVARIKQPGRGWAYTGAILGGLVSIAANVAHSFLPPAHACPDVGARTRRRCRRDRLAGVLVHRGRDPRPHRLATRFLLAPAALGRSVAGRRGRRVRVLPASVRSAAALRGRTRGLPRRPARRGWPHDHGHRRFVGGRPCRA